MFPKDVDRMANTVCPGLSVWKRDITVSGLLGAYSSAASLEKSFMSGA